jgi:aspartate racemase
MKTLGLIGGMSWISTIEYYRGINESVNKSLGGSQYPRLVMYSLNSADVQDVIARGDWDGFLEIMAKPAEYLRDAGAQAILLCSNTSHVVADRLQAAVGLPVISVVDACAKAIKAAGLDRVELLGTRATMELEFFGTRLKQNGISVLIPSEADRAFIHASIFEELGRGVFHVETKRKYLAIISALHAAGAQGAVLGCTEIPLLIRPDDVPLPVFDTTAIHVAEAAQFILS